MFRIKTIIMAIVVSLLFTTVLLPQDKEQNDEEEAIKKIHEETEKEIKEIREKALKEAKENIGKEFEKWFAIALKETGDKYIEARDTIAKMNGASILLEEKYSDTDWKVIYVANVCDGWLWDAKGSKTLTILSMIAQGIDKVSRFKTVTGEPGWSPKSPEKKIEDPEKIGEYLSWYGADAISQFYEILLKIPEKYPWYGRKGVVLAMEKKKNASALPILKEVAEKDENDEVKAAAKKAIETIETAIKEKEKEGEKK